MLIHEDILVSEELISEKFVCDLVKCKGACCVEGDAGAPLEREELPKISKNLDAIKKYMETESKTLLEDDQFFEKDQEGELVTKCRPKDSACIFAKKEASGIWACAVEKAYRNGESDFKKPISCHLYPIRVKQLGAYTALNYDEWEICRPACAKGNALKVPVYQFAKDALVRRFGPEWYGSLVELVTQFKRSQNLKD